MSRKLLSALLLIGLLVVVLLLNTGGRTVVEFGLFDSGRLSAALAFFSFTVVGVVIGLLLK